LKPIISLCAHHRSLPCSPIIWQTPGVTQNAVCRKVQHDPEGRHAKCDGGKRQQNFDRRVGALEPILPGHQIARGPGPKGIVTVRAGIGRLVLLASDSR
jgi:hypothetical protein